MQQIQQDRTDRIARDHAHEVQKIEITNFDVDEIEIDTRILNKIMRKINRHK